MKMRITMETRTAAGFFRRAKGLARAMDRGERLVAERRISFEDPGDLLRVLSGRRVEIVAALREGPTAIAALAERLGRSRAVVIREVRALEAMGLVATGWELGSDGRRRRVVCRVAERYELRAAF